MVPTYSDSLMDWIEIYLKIIKWNLSGMDIRNSGFYDLGR